MNETDLQYEITTVANSAPVVTDAVSRDAACEFLKQIKAQAKRVIDAFADQKAKAAATHKAICSKEREFLAPLENAERMVKAQIGTFDMAERERQRAEEERRRKEAAEALELAREAEAAGDADMAAEAVAIATMEAAQVTATPKTAGVSTRYEWRARIVDPAKVPRHFMIVDEKAVAAYVKATGGRSQIDGVEIYEAPVISARG